METISSRQLLTDVEEQECANVIETIFKHASKISQHGEAIGSLLWQLKYRLLREEGRVASPNFHKHMEKLCRTQNLKFHQMGDSISFRSVCEWLNDLGLFESAQSLYVKVWAYEQRLKVKEEFGVDISNLNVSDATLMELRKIPEHHQQEVLETAIYDIVDNKGGKKVTARSIKEAREVVFGKQFDTPYIKLPEKKIPTPKVEPDVVTLTKKQMHELQQKAVEEYQTMYQEELIGLKVEIRRQAEEEALRQAEFRIKYLESRAKTLDTKLQKAHAEIRSLKERLEAGIQRVS